MDYYDLILGLIPVSIAGAAGMVSLLGLGLSIGITVGALVSLALILHALFVRAPLPASKHDAQNRSRTYPSAD